MHVEFFLNPYLPIPLGLHESAIAHFIHLDLVALPLHFAHQWNMAGGPKSGFKIRLVF